MGQKLNKFIDEAPEVILPLAVAGTLTITAAGAIAAAVTTPDPISKTDAVDVIQQQYPDAQDYQLVHTDPNSSYLSFRRPNGDICRMSVLVEEVTIDGAHGTEQTALVVTPTEGAAIIICER